MSFANVPGVPAAPPAFGLVAVAARPDLTDPLWSRWEQGMAWVPERCGVGWQLVPWCTDPAEEGYEPPRAGSAFVRPVGVRFADACSTLGGPVDLERVVRVAEASTPFVIARELWAGTATVADPHPLPVTGAPGTNPHLASADADEVTAPAGMSAAGALARLEQAALEASRGQQVALHVPVSALPALHDGFRAVGGQLVTYAGNLLIADGGYPGTGPGGVGDATGATTWAYATTPPVVLMSPLDIDRDDQSRVDRATNTRTTWSSRVVAALFDPCVHLATQLTLTS